MIVYDSICFIVQGLGFDGFRETMLSALAGRPKCQALQQQISKAPETFPKTFTGTLWVGRSYLQVVICLDHDTANILAFCCSHEARSAAFGCSWHC